MEKYYLDLVTKKPLCIKGKSVSDIVAKVDLSIMREINTDEYQKLNLALIKREKLNTINKQAQQFIDEITNIESTPNFERETWSIQREEAKAWFGGNAEETPTLALIAQARGVPLEVLRQKAYDKAKAYQTVAAVVAGQRQAYEDRLNRAETLEQIRAIEPSYQLPQQGGSDE